MKAMVCEMCGSNDILKTGGVFVCQHCGTKYDVEEARKLMTIAIAGPVSVQGIATTDNLVDRAQEFFDLGDMDRASEYVTRVLDIDAHNERARDMQRAINVRRASSVELALRVGMERQEDTREKSSLERERESVVATMRSVSEAKAGYLAEAKEHEYMALATRASSPGASSPKSRGVTFALCLFLGFYGAHCFYARRYGRGILYLFTCGLFLFGWIWDIIQIMRGQFTDRDGLPIV